MTTLEKIQKRNGRIVDFDIEKIVAAIDAAFNSELGSVNTVEARSIADQVVRKLEELNLDIAPNVEQIQDLVEQALMERGFYTVAKSYIIYRYQHDVQREEKKEEIQHKIVEQALQITKRDGSLEAFDPNKLYRTLSHAVKGYESLIDASAIVTQCTNEVYDGITSEEVSELLIMVTRSFIERDAAYSTVAARLLLFVIYREVIGNEIDYTKLDEQYREAFVKNLHRGVEQGKLDEKLLAFDLKRLAQALVIDRDYDFKYLGLQTVYDRYFVRNGDVKRILETPQTFWMRIAMGTALNETENKEERVLEFYEIMSKMYYTPSTPTLFHAGGTFPQLSSCFLQTVPDATDGIFKAYADAAQLSRFSGGIGMDWTRVRATGSYISKIGIQSQGVIPFLKIQNDVTAAINRSGRRRGATCVYMEVWHLDFPDFAELRKNTGDERRRAHDLNTAAWIPDLFMQRVEEDGEWTLFSPNEVVDLHELYGQAFKERYEYYEQQAKEGNIKLHRTIKAADLWRKIVTMLFETGHPWVTFKDPSNVRSPQDHEGVVHSSNLCTEITLNTKDNETAVCNLGSLNFARFVKDGVFDRALVARVVPVAMRMLDNVIDLNFYPTEDSKRSNMRHRPVGLGVRGYQDALYQLGINFDSDAAVAFADESMEVVAYHAILASSRLASERGSYETYEGSKWSRGILPHDTIELLEQERGESIDIPRNERLDWTVVRQSVSEFGMRNSNTMAIAPTATTANIVGCMPTIEPTFKNLYVKANQAGDYIVTNDYLIDDLKARGLWNRSMLEQLKYHDGSIQNIAEIPQDLKDKYKEVFDIDSTWLVKAAAYRARWIDQSQSLNIFFRGVSGKALTEVYFYAWRLGLKTTYYLRTEAASQVEKSTVDTAQFGSTHKRVSDNSIERISAGMSAQSPVQPSPVEAPAFETVGVPSGQQSAVTDTNDTSDSSETTTVLAEPQVQTLAKPTVKTVVADGPVCESCEG